ncbi:MAG: Bax inhibitor-1/YccA family protein [Roseateles sp.]|jgi:modulator of FtsH protease|nr:BAX inhibitor protein [Methylibium sp.]MBY0368989.1 Bax inhibitor-1/YccA family protein [Burkholderiaceae bacterium]|mmetsp:Transcript_26232/g.62021  ORF Transcript_26232/g.62021 Transcript_26232/m.62021 type:complete len:228 (+) Transcript_26232:1437-2120(+)
MQNQARTVAIAMPYGAAVDRGTAHRVLRNTYALLSMTLLFSAAVAAAAVAFKLPAPGLILTLAVYFGLLFGIHKLKNRGAGVGLVFALTGFMGWTLGPLLTRTLAMPSGGQAVMLALGATGAVFLALSAYATTTKRDLSWMGGFLFAGMIVALLAGLAAVFFQIPALALTVSAAVALLSAGLILFETKQIVDGGETNYVLATVGLFVSVFNLFTSLLQLFGFMGSDD